MNLKNPADRSYDDSHQFQNPLDTILMEFYSLSVWKGSNWFWHQNFILTDLI